MTWGAVKAMSWQFYKAYSDEAYAVLSHDWIAKNGKAVAGFDLKTLEADLQLIHQVPSKLAGFTRRSPGDYPYRALRRSPSAKSYSVKAADASVAAALTKE